MINIIINCKFTFISVQVLEDEQYRDVPSVHLFYRPARQMIYAILFNMNHQKYIFAKHARQQSHPKVPTIEVNEWIWSPQNEYKRSEAVHAVQLPWPVPTIQRLWFGGLFEDKQRRMKAFLTVMRSDNSLMLNRDYVPQHMLVLATVLRSVIILVCLQYEHNTIVLPLLNRYIVTNPERNILSRQELDAFLATAFSPHIVNIEYLQELVVIGKLFLIKMSSYLTAINAFFNSHSFHACIYVASTWAHCSCKASKRHRWPTMLAASHCPGPLSIRGCFSTASCSI